MARTLAETAHRLHQLRQKPPIRLVTCSTYTATSMKQWYTTTRFVHLFPVSENRGQWKLKEVPKIFHRQPALGLLLTCGTRCTAYRFRKENIFTSATIGATVPGVICSAWLPCQEVGSVVDQARFADFSVWCFMVLWILHNFTISSWFSWYFSGIKTTWHLKKTVFPTGIYTQFHRPNPGEFGIFSKNQSHVQMITLW